MKKFLPLLLLAIFTGTLYSQTGTGVVLQGSDTFTFPPTTLNESMTKEIYLVNTVGVDQDVIFSGLDAPFSLQNSHIENISTQDSILVSIDFSPTELGVVTDTLDITGSVFGSASLILIGDGIQVQLVWEPSSIMFETTAIYQTNTQSIYLSSVGDGTALISDIMFSNSAFSVDSSNSTFSIPEGEEGSLAFVFSPVDAGIYGDSAIIYTNDPNNSEITITLAALAISEVSGDICDEIWTLDNSPYTLVGDITVSDSCSLTIEPGVEIFGDGYVLDILGDFTCIGTDEQSITVEDLAIICDSSSVAMSYVDFLRSDSTYSTSEVDGTPLEIDWLSEDFGTFLLDVYHEDFESYGNGTNNLFSCDNTYSGSDYSSSYTSPTNNGCYYMYVESSSTYSHSGNKSFRFESDNYSADLYYEDDIEVPVDGKYYLIIRSFYSN